MTVKKPTAKRTKKAAKNIKAKKSNPLYVVTNKGKVVEEAKGHIDAIIKSMGLAPLIEFLEEMFRIIVSTVTSYPMFVLLKEYIDDLVARLEKMVGKIENFLPFNL